MLKIRVSRLRRPKHENKHKKTPKQTKKKQKRKNKKKRTESGLKNKILLHRQVRNSNQVFFHSTRPASLTVCQRQTWKNWERYLKHFRLYFIYSSRIFMIIEKTLNQWSSWQKCSYTRGSRKKKTKKEEDVSIWLQSITSLMMQWNSMEVWWLRGD